MAEASRRLALFWPDDPDRTTRTLIDLSVWFNMMVYEISQANQSMVYRDPLPGGTTKVNIERVADREEKRFRRIAERFPYGWPLHEQGAYILRAYSGLQIFPDANHRTGLAISRAHLRLNDHVLDARLADWKALVGDLKQQHGPYFSRCRADGIALRNRCFMHVASFYEQHCRRRNIVDRFRERVARRQPLMGELAFWDEEPAAEAARKRFALDEGDDTPVVPPS